MIEIIQGDITEIQVDAIVNAANTSLLGGGGVDGRIHRVGGSSILEECRTIINKQGKCKTGEAVITNAGKLPAMYVIHAVGPVWNNGKQNEEELLKTTYSNCLKLAESYNLQSISFPNISTGRYGFPKVLAAEIALTTTTTYLQNKALDLRVVFVCYEDDNFNIYREILKK